MTNQQWQLAARTRLQNADHQEPHPTARLLLDWATQKKHASLTCPDEILGAETLAKLESALQKLEARVPLPHLTGRANFLRFGI